MIVLEKRSKVIQNFSAVAWKLKHNSATRQSKTNQKKNIHSQNIVRIHLKSLIRNKTSFAMKALENSSFQSGAKHPHHKSIHLKNTAENGITMMNLSKVERQLNQS